MATVSTPQTLRLTGSLTTEPAIPVVGGTESAVAINEAMSVKSVFDSTREMIGLANWTVSPNSFIGQSTFGFLMVEASNTVQVSSGSFGLIRGTGTFFIWRADSNVFSGDITIQSQVSSSTTNVRVVLGTFA